MTLPYLGGAGENLGPGLNAIVDSIGQLLRPNAKFENQMKALFMEKPELMQKFVDIEKANPGTMKAFGFGDAGSDMISRMQESIPGLSARLLAPQVAEELQRPGSPATRAAVSQSISGKTEGELAQDDFSGWFAKEGKKLLESDPEMFIRAARAKFGTGSKVENMVEDRAVETIEQSKPLRDRPPMEIVQDVAAGKLRLSEVTGLLVGPEGHAVQMAMKLHQDEKEARTRMFMAQYGRDQNDTITRTKLAAAIDAWQAAKGKGTLGGWYSHLWGESTFGAPAAGDSEVIASTLKDQQLDQRTKQLTTMFKSIEPLIAAVHKGGPESEQKNRISRINEVLQENNSQWTAFWDEKGIFNFGRLGFRNKAGLVTDDPGAVTSEIPPSNLRDGNAILESQLSPQQRALAGQLKTLTGQARSARIAQIRARAPSPEVANIIIQLGGGE